MVARVFCFRVSAVCPSLSAADGHDPTRRAQISVVPNCPSRPGASSTETIGNKGAQKIADNFQIGRAHV